MGLYTSKEDTKETMQQIVDKGHDRGIEQVLTSSLQITAPIPESKQWGEASARFLVGAWGGAQVAVGGLEKDVCREGGHSGCLKVQVGT